MASVRHRPCRHHPHKLPAVDAVSRFDGWRPDDHDAVLFDLLPRVDLAELTASWEVLATPCTVQGSPVCCEFTA